MNEVAAKPEDKATPAQLSDPAPMEIEIVDTPVAPEGEQQAPPAPASPLIAGKFRTPEEAEKAYLEAQRAMHEKAQEAATYRKLLEERQAAPTPAHYQAPPTNFDDRLRERLAENPGETLFGMIQHVAGEMLRQEKAQQMEAVKKYQSFASRPEYADIAQDAASELPFAQPIDPIEAVFLRKKLAKLEAQLASGNTNREVAVPFVEPGAGYRRAGNNSLRVELEPDTAKLRSLGDARMRELAKVVAKQKMGGGTMREMSIDDWEKTNA